LEKDALAHRYSYRRTKNLDGNQYIGQWCSARILSRDAREWNRQNTSGSRHDHIFGAVQMLMVD